MFFKKTEETTTLSSIKEESFEVILHLLDYDGCISHRQVIEPHCTDIVLNNQAFIETLQQSKTSTQDSVRLIGSGSARQSVGLDIYSANYNRNGSSFIDLQQIAKAMAVPVSPILLPDIFNDLPKGTTLSRGLDPHNKESHPSFIPDESKLTLMHMSIHSIVEDYPNKKTLIDFYDDRQDDILPNLVRYYRLYPEMIPANVTLRISHYAGERNKTLDVIQGTGEFDVHYRQTVIDMIAITPQPQGSARSCVAYASPQKLKEYRRSFIDQMPEKNEINYLKVFKKHTCLYTYKSAALQTELEQCKAGDKVFIDSEQIAAWVATSPEHLSQIFKKMCAEKGIKNKSLYWMQVSGYFNEALLYTDDTSSGSVFFASSGATLLHVAVLQRNAIALDYLVRTYVKNGVSLDGRTRLKNPVTPYCDKTALDCALMKSSGDEIAYTLFQKGARLSPRKTGENHLIHALTRLNKFSEIKALLEKEPELIDFPDKEGNTIIFYAKQLAGESISNWLEQTWSIIEPDLTSEWQIIESDSSNAGCFKYS